MTDESASESLNVSELLAVMLEQISAVAWQKLGLMPDFATRTIQMDLAQAKLAIDAAGALTAVLEPSVDEEDRRRLQNLLTDLRVNFVEKSKESLS